MNWDKYRQEIDGIKIDATFNARLIQNLQQYQKPFIKQRYFFRYASIGVILCVMFLYGVISQQKSQPSKKANQQIAVQKEKKELPILAYDPVPKGGMGILSFTNLSPDELQTNTPWTYTHDLKEIPVYRNATITDVTGGNVIEGGLTDEEIDEKINHYARLFNLNTFISLDVYPQNNPFFISNYYEEGNIQINRFGDTTITIYVDENIAKKFRDIPATKKQAEQRVLQFAQLFQDELKLENPIADVFMSYATLLNEETQQMKLIEPHYVYKVFDKKKNVQEQIEAYSFSSIGFYFNYEIPNFKSTYAGPSISISFNESIVGQEVGVYPIISAKDAETLFYAGKYITNSPDADLNQKITSMKLVYEYRRDSTYAIPFYCIYAPIAPNDLHIPLEKGTNYGVYYVPAIPFKYMDIVDAKGTTRFYG